MKKLLTIAMAAMLLASCNFRQSSIPADWVGSWFSADGGWQCSLYEQVALYNNDVWHYQSVTETDSTLNVAITNNGRTVNLSLLVKKGDLGRVLGKYYVDGKLIGHVYKNYAQAAAELLPKFDSAAGITPVERVAPKAAVPDGNIGTAVVRLHVRNDMRGTNSLTVLGKIGSPRYVTYSNRLETAQQLMLPIERNRYGWTFEATIPVDGIADFVFSDKPMWVSTYTYVLPNDFINGPENVSFRTAVSYQVAQGDTVMVVVDLQRAHHDAFPGEPANYFNRLGSLPPFPAMFEFNMNRNLGEDKILNETTDFLNRVDAITDSALRTMPAYSQYYTHASNRARYIAGYFLQQYMYREEENGQKMSERFMKFMADNFPTADSCILQTPRSVEFGRSRSGLKPYPLSANNENHEVFFGINVDMALRNGCSQLAADVFQVRELTTWLNTNAVKYESLAIDSTKLMSVAAEIKTPAYRNYLENRCREFLSRRSYIERVYNGEKLTDSELDKFAQLTDKKCADDLLAIQENLSDYDYALPRVEITVTSHNPGTFYLYDSEYPKVAIDSLYSSHGFYVFHNKLEVGRNYTVKCGGKEKCSFTVTNELFNSQLSFSD